MIEIVGGGLAAAKLVEAYRAAGGGDEITIWSQDPHGPYHRPPLSKRLLRGESQPEDALVHPVDWYAENGVDLRLGETLASLDEARAETVVIATGSRPRRLDGAVALRTLDDSLELRRLAGEARTATVIGGGFVGCEVTASLTQLGVQVTQIVRDADGLRAAAGAAALRGAARHVPGARGRPQARGDRDPRRRPRRRGHRRRAERRARPRRRASRFGAASSSTSGSRPHGPAPMRSATSPSSTTRSTGATGGSSTGRTRPTTARRSAGSSPARTHGTTSSRRSSPRSSARASRHSATPPVTTRRRSRATSAAIRPCCASTRTATSSRRRPDRPRTRPAEEALKAEIRAGAAAVA